MASLPLSAAQLGVWRDLQLHPGDLSYSIWDYIEIPGNIDRAVLTRAIAHVIASNVALRLVVREEQGRPCQRIMELDPADVVVAHADFSADIDPKAAAIAWMTSDHASAFDLTSGPLFRTALLSIAPNRLYWYRNFHHIIADGFSLALMGLWVAATYRELIAGNAPPDLQQGDYRDFLRNEAQYRATEQWQSDSLFWRSRYPSLPEPVSLAVRMPRNADVRATHRSTLWIYGNMIDRMYELAARLSVSVGQILVAVIVLYIHRATGARDIPVSMPVHGRSRNTMTTIGMCVNTLPLCFRVDPGSRTDTTIADICARIAEASQHRHFRFEDFRAAVGLRSDEPHPFRIVANVLRAGNAWDFGTEPVQVHTESMGPVQDLSILVLEATQRDYIRVMFVANAALYDEWELDAHKAHLQTLIESIAANTSIPVGELSLLTPRERHRLLVEYNATTVEHMDRGCFHELVARQATRRPDAIAVLSKTGSLTYEELERRSNLLARHLQALGVELESIVGLCTRRDEDFVIGMLGILKAGGAFLPLDPEMPEARLALMVKDAQARCIVTQAEFENILPEHNVRHVFLDAHTKAIEAMPSATPESAARADGLAYVIYTSGSTGAPKGVMLQHDGLCNLALGQSRALQVQPGVRVLQYARPSFDACVYEVAITLSAGGTLCMAPASDLLPGPNLARVMRELGVNVAVLPPSAMPWLVPFDFPDLKVVVVAGEACPEQTVEVWSRRCRFINAYGPTETTVCATFGQQFAGKPVTIGRPIDNLRIYILDAQGRPVPHGIVGEINIGGIGVARGYLKQPELTAERFVHDDFAATPNARMYRSGDRARWRPDGQIEFLGRTDEQVKIRGFRIELGEIEAALRRHSAVRDCAVVVRNLGERLCLVAYVVTAESAHVDQRMVRAFLRERLPDYMIPAAVMRVESIPLSPSGKVNRRLLPAIDLATDAQREYVPPRTPLEQRIAAIWSQALGTDRISVRDNFFDLGGDSLAVIQAIASIWTELQVEIPAADLYEASDLHSFAESVEHRRARARPNEAGNSRMLVMDDPE